MTSCIHHPAVSLLAAASEAATHIASAPLRLIHCVVYANDVLRHVGIVFTSSRDDVLLYVHHRLSRMSFKSILKYTINPDPGYPDFPYSYRLKKYLYSRLPIFILKNRRPAAATYLMTPLSLRPTGQLFRIIICW